ncbi:MAG TPA: hypothetical protein DEB06_09750 [Phycisphaerales bacterium]|nr:hypothetical protein [Phycisphaerales bacterium]
MTAGVSSPTVEVCVGEDGATAIVRLPDGVDPALVTMESCAAALRRAHVVLGADTLELVENFIAAARAGGARERAIGLVEEAYRGARTQGPGGAARVVSGPIEPGGAPVVFHGPTRVEGGIKAGATLECAGGLIVTGAIEGATLRVSGDFEAQGGFAGRGKGELRVHGAARARYLDAVQGEVLRQLRVEGQIINCHLLVHGGLDCPSGSLIGGRCESGGRVVLATLGSDSATLTELVLGRVPLLEPLVGKLDGLLERAGAAQQKSEAELAQLSVPGRRLSAFEKERRCELEFDVQTMRDRMARAALMRHRTAEVVATLGAVDLSVGRTVFPGAAVEVGKQVFRVRKQIHGPVRVVRGTSGDLVCVRDGAGEGTPLAAYSEVKARAA